MSLENKHMAGLLLELRTNHALAQRYVEAEQTNDENYKVYHDQVVDLLEALKARDDFVTSSANFGLWYRPQYSPYRNRMRDLYDRTPTQNDPADI